SASGPGADVAWPLQLAAASRARHGGCPVTIRLRRSCVAVPGSSEKMLRKAGENAAFGADQFFLDLEDAVAPGVKEAARANVVAALNEYRFGSAIRVVRVNAADHP